MESMSLFINSLLQIILFIFCRVKLLIHKTTGDKIACKIINHDKYKDAAANVTREITIHKTLDHENIIKYYGRRQEPTKEYIFLEYAAGGELFQLIGL